MAKELTMNKDDEYAYRINRLALYLLHSDTPVSTDRIKNIFYSDQDETTQEKTFQRDRNTLQTLGYVLKESTSSTDNFKRWSIDKTATFSENNLNVGTYLIIKVLVLSMLGKENNPYSQHLLFALNKIGFISNYPEEQIIKERAFRSEMNEYLQKCFLNRCTCTISYETSRKISYNYNFNIYGFFNRKSYQYVVGENLNGEDNPIYTLRIDRIKEANVKEGRVRYEIPSDFDVDDYIHLPFQYGYEDYEAKFYIPKESLKNFKSEYENIGSVKEENGKTYWYVNVKNTNLACAWALPLYIYPVKPSALCETYINRLKEA